MSDPYAELGLAGAEEAAEVRRRRERQLGDALVGLVVLLAVVLGIPQVWQRAVSGGMGLELLFYPVLGAAFGYLAVLRRSQR